MPRMRRLWAIAPDILARLLSKTTQTATWRAYLKAAEAVRRGPDTLDARRRGNARRPGSEASAIRATSHKGTAAENWFRG
jgi:hypothetical protein